MEFTMTSRANEWIIIFDPSANVFLARNYQFGSCVREEPSPTLEDAIRAVAFHTGTQVVMKVITSQDTP